MTQTERPALLPTAFEDNLGWLLAQCFRAHVVAMDGVLADFPHGHRGYQALSGAARCSARNQAELAKQLGVDRTVMVYLVDDLEKAGLVERVADPADRRSRLIRATAKGVERLENTAAAISAAEDALMSTLDGAQRADFVATLRAIAAHHADRGFNACDVAQQARETDPC